MGCINQQIQVVGHQLFHRPFWDPDGARTVEQAMHRDGIGWNSANQFQQNPMKMGWCKKSIHVYSIKCQENKSI